MFIDKYFAFVKANFKANLAYKLEFMFSIIISPLMLIMLYFVWGAVYSNSGAASISGFTFQGMITYYVLSMVIGHFIWNTIGFELQQKITYGELNQDLLKPVSVFSQFFSAAVAERFLALFAEVIPVFLISFFLFNLNFPGIYTLFFIIALILSFIINFLISFLFGCIAFWIYRIESLQWFLLMVVRIFSGEFIPLDFFGTSFLRLSELLPFYYLRYGIIQLFLGKLTLSGSLKMIMMQLGWIIVLYLVIRLVWRISIKKYGAEGG